MEPVGRSGDGTPTAPARVTTAGTYPPPTSTTPTTTPAITRKATATTIVIRVGRARRADRASLTARIQARQRADDQEKAEGVWEAGRWEIEVIAGLRCFSM